MISTGFWACGRGRRGWAPGRQVDGRQYVGLAAPLGCRRADVGLVVSQHREDDGAQLADHCADRDLVALAFGALLQVVAAQDRVAHPGAVGGEPPWPTATPRS